MIIDTNTPRIEDTFSPDHHHHHPSSSLQIVNHHTTSISSTSELVLGFSTGHVVAAAAGEEDRSEAPLA